MGFLLNHVSVMAGLRENDGELHHPWLVAVWPGMGHVAVTAGFYLLAKLGMHQFAEFSAQELFDYEHVDVMNGLIRSGRLPRSRFFAWNDPERKRDLLVFLGEAQPPGGKNAFCRQLVRYARDLDVERVFTFAAMATRMDPSHRARVFAAATSRADLEELGDLGVDILQEGRISGLNGVLLGMVAEMGMRGCCLLGEMPHVLSQVAFPKASLAVLTVFTRMAGIEVELADLREEANDMDRKLGALLGRVEEAMAGQPGTAGREVGGTPDEDPGDEEPGLPPKIRRHIEDLFAEAREHRPKAYELKKELDRHGVFADYEDRFLDLFREGGNPDR